MSASDPVALVTGAAGGIGKGVAEVLVEAGWSVAIADRDPEVLAVAEQLGGRGTVLDVTDQDAVDAWANGEPDAIGLVNSAGVCKGEALVVGTDAEWQEILDINLMGSVRVLRAFARNRLAAGGGGSAVLVASNNAFWPCRQMAAYCASKAGVLMLGRCVASELGEHDIRVNVLAPGETETPMTLEALDIPGERETIIERTPMGRLGLPRDIGLAARMLLSDDASWITGQLISADGGISLRGESDLNPVR